MDDMCRKLALPVAVDLGLYEPDEAMFAVVPTRAIAFGMLCEVQAQMGYEFDLHYEPEGKTAHVTYDKGGAGVVAVMFPAHYPDGAYNVFYYTQG
jgi:hypothetical protein